MLPFALLFFWRLSNITMEQVQKHSQGRKKSTGILLRCHQADGQAKWMSIIVWLLNCNEYYSEDWMPSLNYLTHLTFLRKWYTGRLSRRHWKATKCNLSHLISNGQWFLCCHMYQVEWNIFFAYGSTRLSPYNQIPYCHHPSMHTACSHLCKHLCARRPTVFFYLRYPFPMI